jgi:hypothetical protein
VNNANITHIDQKGRAVTKNINAEGVRELHPPVESKGRFSVTPQALANTFGVDIAARIIFPG